MINKIISTKLISSTGINFPRILDRRSRISGGKFLLYKGIHNATKYQDGIKGILLNKLIKNIIYNGVGPWYNIINIRNKTINKLNNIQIKKNNIIKEYVNGGEILYKWSNNKIINITNIDNIIKYWLYLLFNINPDIKNLYNNNIYNNKNIKISTKIYTSEPIFLHTNNKLNIIIRILIPNLFIGQQLGNPTEVDNKKQNTQRSNNNINNIYNNIMNIILENDYKINIINILTKIYNKKVIISPIIIKDNGVNEFIASISASNTKINKYNKYIVPKSIIIKNNYININLIYNILYYNNIYKLFNNNNIFKLNNYMVILSNLNNRYITGYNIKYSGKLPKADSSSRTTSKLFNIGTSHNSKLISNSYYSYNNNGLASTKAIIASF